jgi:exopolyphosphatase / guanosine-5'-triphosphate,3'-diphosphate pyrophosphatase
MALGARRVDREGAFAGNTPRTAIIDIGSNSVRMVLYGGSPRAPDVLFNEKVVPRLGSGMKDGRLAKPAMELALRGLRRFALILTDLGIGDVETVATAAVREAANADEFLARVRAAGLDPRVISGEEEARLAAMGVIGAFPGARGVVADLGGGSLELVSVADAACGEGTSLPLGTLRLPGLAGATFEDSAKVLARAIRDGGWSEQADGALYLVGGTWRALAVHAMERLGSALTDPHAFELGRKDALRLAERIAGTDPDTLRRSARLSTLRAELLPQAGPLLHALLKKLAPERVVFSSWGLREGLLFDRIAPDERLQDPLLAGVSVFANMRGCPPTLATRIAGWTVNAMPPGWDGSERVRLAATSLALASMQVEPNLRLETARNWAMQKRWLALSAEERALIAATTAANGARFDLPPEIAALADPDRLHAAVCWGLAIRLCRRLGGRSRMSLQASRLRTEGARLVLELEHARRDLYGVPTEKDLAALSGRLGLEPELRVVPDATISAGSPF